MVPLPRAALLGRRLGRRVGGARGGEDKRAAADRAPRRRGHVLRPDTFRDPGAAHRPRAQVTNPCGFRTPSTPLASEHAHQPSLTSSSPRLRHLPTPTL